MAIIEFKQYDINNNIDFLNKFLVKASQDRFELRKAKNGVYYLYDYDDREIIRNKIEIKDILDNQFLENFCNKEDYKRIEKIFKEVNIL